MANDTAGLFQTLVAPAAATAAQHLVFQNAFLRAIYWDYQPVVASPYKDLSVTVPTVSEADVADIGAGGLTPTDTAHSAFTITLDRHFSSSWVVKSFDDIRSPQDLSAKYIAPRLEALKRRMNRSIASLITVANFGTYSLISGAGADVFQRADLAGCWKNLAGAGAPLDDAANLFFRTTTTAYGNMTSDTTFAQEAIVGINDSQIAYQQARLAPLLGATVVWDQHLSNYNAGKEAGIFMHRYAIAGVTADPPSSGGAVQEMTMLIADKVPVQLQFAYSLPDQGYLFNLHCFWGVKVTRPELGSLTETA